MVDVYADGEYVITLSEDTVIESGLKIGMPLDVDTLENAARAERVTKAKAKAYNYLSYGDMSAKTLKTKLSRAGFDDVSDIVICNLQSAGYIDDERYALALSKHLAENKLYGARRIMQELYLKGIDSGTAEIAVSALETDFYESARACVPKAADFSDKKQVSKIYGALARRGFDYDIISSVISEFISDTEEF